MLSVKYASGCGAPFPNSAIDVGVLDTRHETCERIFIRHVSHNAVDTVQTAASQGGMNFGLGAATVRWRLLHVVGQVVYHTRKLILRLRVSQEKMRVYENSVESVAVLSIYYAH